MNNPPRQIHRLLCACATVSRCFSQGNSRTCRAGVGGIPKIITYASREPVETFGPALCSMRE